MRRVLYGSSASTCEFCAGCVHKRIFPWENVSSTLLEHGSSFSRQKMELVFCSFVAVPLWNSALCYCYCAMRYVCCFSALLFYEKRSKFREGGLCGSGSWQDRAWRRARASPASTPSPVKQQWTPLVQQERREPQLNEVCTYWREMIEGAVSVWGGKKTCSWARFCWVWRGVLDKSDACIKVFLSSESIC